MRLTTQQGLATAQEKPCLVAAGQGFSVSYKGRSLYSRYNPQKVILQTVTGLPLLPNTLILCASPCLCYGLAELAERMPADCFLLCVEADAELHALAAEHFSALQARHPKLLQAAALLDSAEVQDIVAIITSGKAAHCQLPPIHSFRRAIIVEMSGGTAFYAPLYRSIALAAENAVATFWKNRLTLTTFGRLYARNLFKNLARLPDSVPLARLCHSVTKPLLLFGAGESAEATLEALPRAAFKRLYVIAVDAALPILRGRGITPDCVVAVESQLAIEKAYIGNPHAAPLLLADMLSRAQVTAHVAAKPTGAVSYFMSAYADARFIRTVREQGILPPLVPPLGSVGLTATYLALQLRASDAVPVFVTGLDFSFSLGATHARGAPAHTARLSATKRLRPVANVDAAFKTGACRAAGKQGAVFTDRALSGYAAQFADHFADAANLYDAGAHGLPLKIPRIASHELLSFLTTAAQDETPAPAAKSDNAEPCNRARVAAFFQQEQAALERLRDLLVHGEAVRATSMTVQEEITALLAPRDYLYLHFPDGYQCRPSDIGFLKRVRSEIDFFIKDIAAARLRIAP